MRGNKMKKYTFTEAKKEFLDLAGKSYKGKMPSQKYSTHRLGGWVIKSNDDRYLGFIGYRGGSFVYNQESK
jgi:hypothetical protein|tara:strand:- start:3363 stop:3575 length:213 start_codon:yes stop_codon:yes gene_type:complete